MLSSPARRRRLGWLTAALALVLAAPAVRKPGDETLYPARLGGPTITAYVIDNGFHTNVALPAAFVRAHSGPVARAAALMADRPWIQFGWGDARFYVETGLSPARALDGVRALFGPHNRSAVMLEPLPDAPDRLWKTGVARLELTPAGAERLLGRVDASLVVDEAASPVPLPVSGWGEARFFRSREAFSLFHLCNHWTSDLLHAAGLATRPVLDTASGGVMLDVSDAAARGRQLDTPRQAR